MGHKTILLIRPGQASVLRPKEGIAQLCNTSVDVTKKQVLIKCIIFKRLFTSNNRKPKFCTNKSSSVSITLSKETNCKSRETWILESKNSYVQYHWFPITFTT